MRAFLVLLGLAFALTGCGGGDSPGRCLFGPSACETTNPVIGGTGGTSPTTNFSQSGIGDTVFTLPASVGIVRIQATFSGTSSNFVVKVAENLIVNTIIGTTRNPSSHDGTYVVAAGGQVEISNSNGVSWTVSSTTAGSTSSGQLFAKSGSGDLVFDLPARNSRYTITATYPGTSSNFVVNVNGSLIVNSIIGSSRIPVSFDGTYLLPSQGRVEITNSSGVVWQFLELP